MVFHGIRLWCLCQHFWPWWRLLIINEKSAMRTCERLLSFIPFSWSLFLKVSIWEFNCYKWEAITAKIKVLLWTRRHCTRGRKLVAPWPHLRSKSKCRQERRACEDSQAENQFHSPGASYWLDHSSRDSLTPREQLAIVDLLMSSKDCEQHLFRSEIHRKEFIEGRKTSLTARVTCEWLAAKLRIVISAGSSRLYVSRSHAHDPPSA